MVAQSVKEGLKMRINKLHSTADKREIKDLSKLPSATSFIRHTLSEMPKPAFRIKGAKIDA